MWLSQLTTLRTINEAYRLSKITDDSTALCVWLGNVSKPLLVLTGITELELELKM